MKRYIIVLLTAMVVSSAVAQSTNTTELSALKSDYRRQMVAATRPIALKYLESLQVLKRKLGGQGNLEAALEVQKEIESISLNETSDKPSVGNGAKKQPKGIDVFCSASKERGTKLGDFKKGDRVSIQYLSGKWVGWPTDPMYSPDDPAFTGNSAGYGRPQLCIIRTGSEETFELLPPNTKETPFIYVCEDDCKLSLRMSDREGQWVDNKGAVTYRVALLK